VALQYQILSVPLVNPGEETEKLNHFLRAHRVVKCGACFPLSGPPVSHWTDWLPRYGILGFRLVRRP